MTPIKPIKSVELQQYEAGLIPKDTMSDELSRKISNSASNYASDMTKWNKEFAEWQIKNNDQYLSKILGGINTECYNLYDVNGTLNQIASARFHGNSNIHSSAIDAKLQAARSNISHLEEMKLKFQQDEKGQYCKVNLDLQKNNNMDNPYKVKVGGEDRLHGLA